MNHLKINNRQKRLEAFDRLLDIMEELRQKCPWDRQQTNESLRTLTIEETYELADAILKDDANLIKKELGDLLLHIVFYSLIGEEKKQFDIEKVIDALAEKLIYRHPHIFGDTEAASAREVEENWEQLKLKEKGGNKSVLDGVPLSLPAMVKANRIQDKVRGVGFDWEHKEQVWEKVQEEIAELNAEIQKKDEDKIEAEFGDLLFSIINAARLYGVNPENALERTNRKFIKRFNFLEQQTIKKGQNLKQMSLEQMDVIWNAAKKQD